MSRPFGSTLFGSGSGNWTHLKKLMRLLSSPELYSAVIMNYSLLIG